MNLHFASEIRGSSGCWTEVWRARIIRAMRDFSHEGLSHDPIHGYISFTAGTAAEAFDLERLLHAASIFRELGPTLR